MNKSNKELILEIVIMVIFLIIAIPACVNASNKYNKRKELLLCNSNVSVNIKTKEDNKIVELTNLNNSRSKVNLILKISKYSNEYAINVDDEYIELKTLTHTEDDNHYYYNLGSYEFEKTKDIKFKLILLESRIDLENITYSFMTEEENC